MSDRALLLIPGLMCDEAVWAPQIGALSGHAQMEVARHELRDSLGAMAEAIIARAPPRFALAGHSMGGRVAFEVMRRASARVIGLALLDTAYLPRPAGAAGERERLGRLELVELARREGMRAMGRRWLHTPMVHPDRLKDETLIESILAMIERSSPEQFQAQVRALLERPDASSLLPGIRCPTLVLCGGDDAWATPGVHRQLAALIPGSRLVSIPDCGHMATMERPGAVSDALLEWWETVSAADSRAAP
ncbi:MAG TPA: alpha/beta fold hydrolase [Steroidobacteraceae bacterium]|nr:alpha/beta fold hydrolase [Steroidobacteraceae bacterium]